MSVKINNLTKEYGEKKAIDGVTFEAKRGEILGFLGPNGAGKTTTMKIISCFLPQNSGTVSVCGFDTVKNSLEVRRKIGYLPEHNPLYRDMFVKEYLTFVADVYGVENKRKRIADLIEMTGLGTEQNKTINSLSKGYRQRVGLAQAIIHDPEVLILDEPTSGLDPNQLIEIRRLIRELGKEKTVIFSTHIMQEVEALCDRVVIINKGKIVANDSVAGLQKITRGNNIVTVQFLEKIEIKELKAIKKVKEVVKIDDYKYQLIADMDTDIRPDVSNFAVKHFLTLVEMRKEKSSVEDIFQFLTK